MASETPTPNINWYLNTSRERGVTPRCPFATVEGCPRYFGSLAMLGETGSTKIAPDEEKRLDALWEKSDLLPRTAEQDMSISGSDGNWRSFSNFCPEAIHGRFGYFASGLGYYVDEIDRNYAAKLLTEIGAPVGDWRWLWAWINPLHYTECPLYSPLVYRQDTTAQERTKAGSGSGELISMKPGLWGMSVNLNEGWRRAMAWWRRRNSRN